jgi:phosphate transport system substrate-binding protein
MKAVVLKWWPLLTLLVLACQRPEGDTPTSGSLTISSADCLAPVAQKQIDEFQRLYEDTDITMMVASSRETAIQFLRGEVQTIFLDRQFSKEEAEIVRAHQIPVDTFRIASEGVAVVVHPANPVAALNLAQIGAIYRGEIKDWLEVGGRRQAILPVALSRNTGTAEFMLERTVHDTAFSRSTYVCASSLKLLETIAQRENGIGFVSSAWLRDSTAFPGATPGKIKALKLATDTTTSYVALFQASVFRGDYPLRRPLYLFSRDRRVGVAAGLITFVTSAAGQKLLLNAGLVPVTMPVKSVELR